jgi:S-adenosylmethionine/arginine decarboxylase-like enzyme
MNKESHWGFHLMVDASGCNENINDVEKVDGFLQRLVYKLGMHPIGGPLIVYVDTPEGKGVSGVQLITTSTLTFHGDDEGKRFFLDVFSCKEYRHEWVFELVHEYFQPTKLTHNFLYRDA